MRRAALLLLCVLACSERRPAGTSGWAAEVPANAIRFVKQAAPVPTAEKPMPPPAPKPVKPLSKITEPTTITLWHAYRATELDALKQTVAEFDKLGTKITVQLRAVPYDAFNDKIKVVVPEDRGPDLFIFAHDLVGAWAEMELIEPLSSWTDAHDTDAFMPETVGALVYRNALYGLPLDFKCVALYYNKKLVPEPPKTLDALIETAKGLSDGVSKFGLAYEVTNLYFHALWVHSFGGQVLDADGKPHVATDEARTALELARDLVQKHKVTSREHTTAMLSGYFNEGSAAMVLSGPWMRGEIVGVDYGVAPLPEIAPGKPARPFLGVEAMYLNRRSKHKEAAMEVMRFLVNDASARIRFDVGKQPVANTAVWVGQTDPIMAAFKTQFATSVVMSSSPKMQQVWTPYNNALLAVVAGTGDPTAALAEAQKKVEEAITKSGSGH